MHEATGPSRHAFATIQMGLQDKSSLWIAPPWMQAAVLPPALQEFCDVGSMIFAAPKTRESVLWAAEEALRSGACPFVIAEIDAPLSLTAGRRLQLAAETGGATGLMLVPEDAGSPAAEMRWRSAPVYEPGESTLYRWELIKNKKGTLGSWVIRWDGAARRVIVVSEAGERAGLARPSN